MSILLSILFISITLLVIISIKFITAQQKIKELLQTNDELRIANINLEKNKHRLLNKIEESDEKLQHAHKMLHKSKEEFNSFSYSISHDLKAPIRAVNGFCSILMEEYSEAMDADGKRTVATIQKNAAHIDALIEDLLELSRLGTVTLNKQKFDMKQVIEQVLGDKNKATAEAVSISPMAEAFADVTLMRQVWENLISNALKFSSHRERSVIDIGFKHEDHEQVYWIRDNGVGFDPDYKDKLFKVFSRLHTKKEFEGTGAGLAIAKKIVEAHDGRIWAEAELSKGATFYFTLPAVD